MVFEVGITLFIHLVCIFSLFAWCAHSSCREWHVRAQQSGREEGRVKAIHPGGFTVLFLILQAHLSAVPNSFIAHGGLKAVTI